MLANVKSLSKEQNKGLIHLLPFSILFQNSHFIIIDKPAGMPVHANRNGQVPSVETSFPLLSKRKDGPWLVHRLDQDTAGCLLIALRKQALLKAQACFANHRVKKIYWAIVKGKPDQPSGTIDTPLLKHTKNHRWSMKPDPNGQKAITQWRVLQNNDSLSLLELTLLTGRTHQARVHCSILGHPIVGDTIYGDPAPNQPPLQLLSRFLALPLIPPVAATAPVPKSMAQLLQQL